MLLSLWMAACVGAGANSGKPVDSSTDCDGDSCDFDCEYVRWDDELPVHQTVNTACNGIASGLLYVAADPSFHAAVADAGCHEDVYGDTSVMAWSLETGSVLFEFHEEGYGSVGYRISVATPSADGVSQPLVVAAYWDDQSDLSSPRGAVILDASGAILADISDPERLMGDASAFAGNVLAAGAQGMDGTVEPRLYAYADDWRPVMGPDDAVAVHENTALLDPIGAQLTTVGDVDGDGVPDIAMFTFSGGRLLTQDQLVTYGGVEDAVPLPIPMTVGRPAANAGDQDGDGIADLAIGSSDLYQEGFIGIGSVATGEVIATLYDDRGAPGTWLGPSVSAIGDVDGDGYDTIIVDEIRGDYPDWDPDFWQIEGPLCGAMTLQEAGTTLPKEDGWIYREYTGGAPGIVVTEVEPRGGPDGLSSLAIWTW